MHPILSKSWCAFFFFFVTISSLVALERPDPLLSIGGGYFDVGRRHRADLLQAEYKWGHYFWRCIRPQCGLMTAEFDAFFIYGGIGVDLYLTKHIVFSPNFCPGIYWHNKRGKNLGFPLEFRSTLELAYELNNHVRIGTQFYHISNASLSNRNPGANEWTVFIAVPFTFRSLFSY